MNESIKSAIIEVLQERAEKMAKTHTAKGIYTYAVEMVEDANESIDTATTKEELKTAILNGAESWFMYSNGGCSLIYSGDIIERLYPKSKIRKYMFAESVSLQTVALEKAYNRILNAWKEVNKRK